MKNQPKAILSAKPSLKKNLRTNLKNKLKQIHSPHQLLLLEVSLQNQTNLLLLLEECLELLKISQLKQVYLETKKASQLLVVFSVETKKQNLLQEVSLVEIKTVSQ